jgi:hypothetical protein
MFALKNAKCSETRAHEMAKARVLGCALIAISPETHVETRCERARHSLHVPRGEGYSVLARAGFQMSNAGRNAEYIGRAGRHSYLNQHNSGDEWLTGNGAGRDAMRSIYGSYYGRISALNV